MSSGKQVDDDNETVASSTEKTDEQEENKSKSAESDDDTSSNASSEYEVEKIISKRRRRRGGFEYYIKWVGYDESANEWIPEASLNCPERLAEFQREEIRKRKRTQNDRSHIQKRRNKKKQSKKRRIKIIDNDDDDEDEEEPAKSIQSLTSSSTTSEKDSIVYGVEKGYKVQAILGINRTKGDQLHYLVHYKSPTIFEDNMELVPANVAKKYCEDELIQFYETRIAWNDRQNN